MRLAHTWPVLGFISLFFVGTAILIRTPAQAEDKPTPAGVQFESQIAPLLAKHCLECHGPTAKKGGLDLSKKVAAFRGGKNGEAIVANKLADSLLWEHVEAGEMPPKSRTVLTAAQKGLIKTWITDGATWPDDLADITHLVVNRNAGTAWVRRLTVPEYIETVQSQLGVNITTEAKDQLPRDLRADGFSNTSYNLTVDLAHVEGYAKLAEIVSRRVDLASFIAKHSNSTELSEANLQRLIRSMGRQLLRGPVEDREVAGYLRLAQAVIKEAGDFPEVTRYLLEAMLQSPRFIYRIENRDTPTARASRLSYILWGGPPDEELLRAAEAGELTDKTQLIAQVQRLIQDRRAVVQSQRFAAEWLNLDRLDTLRPNPKQFTKWDPSTAADMREETLAFFEEVAWTQNRPLAELMNAQVTFLSPRLAAHYGLNKLSTAEQANKNHPPSLAGRATDGLQALYTFHEGQGDLVHDVSGVGEPLHLKIDKPAAVEWGERQLTVKDTTLIASATAPKRLIEAVKKSNEITIEAWLTPANIQQKGPARIATLSAGSNQRNFTLGQEATFYQVRLRTKNTNGNGIPELDGPTNVIFTRPTHVAYTFDAKGQARLYIDGDEKSSKDLGGTLSNWNADFRFALANEFGGDRVWKGTYHLVALYSRALSATEVQGNARGLMRYDLTNVPSRGGLLTQGSLLSIGGDNASTVTRGLFVLKELLNSGVDDPPPGVDTTPVHPKPGMSNRAIALQRLNNKACSECHKKFESIAFGLEKFDGLGSFSEKDRHGNTLRDDGEILFPGQAQPQAFASSAELMNLLAKSETVNKTLTRKITQFALGRPLAISDEPAVEAIHREASRKGSTYAAVIRAVVLSDLVQTYTDEPPTKK